MSRNPKKTTVKVFTSVFGISTDRRFQGQGYQRLTFARELRHVNKEWNQNGACFLYRMPCPAHASAVGESAPDQDVILSAAAISEIDACRAAGDFGERERELEPHSMPPSRLPGDYSKARANSCPPARR